MGRIAHNIILETRSARLLKVVTAYTLTEDIAASTKRHLTDHVKGVRLLTEAGELAAAAECVHSLRNQITDGIPESVVDWPEVMVRTCDDLLRALKGAA